MRSVSSEVVLDIHLCVERPQRYTEALSKAGASRLIFQWEAMPSLQHAEAFGKDIVDSGMRAGISINPETKVEEILPLLETGLFDTVDILAVEPGKIADSAMALSMWDGICTHQKLCCYRFVRFWWTR